MKISEYSNPDLATAPDVTAEDLFELAKYGNDKVRMQVAYQPGISRETFDLLARDNNFDVLRSLAGNENLPEDLFRVLYEKVSNATALYFTPAYHSQHASQPLGEYLLDNDKKDWLKQTLLSNHHRFFDESILEELSQEQNAEVRREVIRNSHVSPETLVLMAKTDPTRKVRKEAKATLARQGLTTKRPKSS